MSEGRDFFRQSPWMGIFPGLAIMFLVMGFNFLQGWVDGRAVDIAESSNEFLDVVSKHYAAKG